MEKDLTQVARLEVDAINMSRKPLYLRAEELFYNTTGLPLVRPPGLDVDNMTYPATDTGVPTKTMYIGEVPHVRPDGILLLPKAKYREPVPDRRTAQTLKHVVG
ncbi:MAG TPA: hypothetical protein VGT05_01645 [Patescibacteria group bacterium]|nr:hypothetical protein [Patescibacteria group bacterium]